MIDWMAHYAELLGLDTPAEPEAIALEIKALRKEIAQWSEKYTRDTCRIVQDTERRVVERLAKQPVNCGHRSTCAVASWGLEAMERIDANGRVEG